MKAINLRTEFLVNPIGIDIKNPLLSWNALGDKKQTAYRVVAYKDNELVYDSKKVNSSTMSVSFPEELHSGDHIIWKVTLWNENDIKGEESEKASFEMSLLNKDDFKAKWIRGNYFVNKNKRYPVDCFKKEITVPKIKKARLYATACGLYEVKINGKRVGSFVLAPGHTDYRKRIQLQTYDISNYLKEGKNIIEAELADGWYRGSCGAWGIKNQYGTQTKLFIQLEYIDLDNNKTTLGTDSSWSWSNDGSIRFADNQDGEIFDMNLKPSYAFKAKETKCKVVPKASNNVNLEEHEIFKVQKVITTKSEKKVLDFGQNIAGYISFKINGKKGEIIKFRFGEMFDKDGEFTQTNIQCRNKKGTKITPRQEVTVFLKDGVNEYKTKFAIFGFQYVLVEGDVSWNKDDFEAIAVYSSMEETLEFKSSNELLNKFVDATRWSAKNNHADVPTDCPTRERHGWTGDAQIFTKTASYLFNYVPFARKYINDMKDGQHKNGCYRQINPEGGVDFYMKPMDGSAGWSDAGVLIPYYIFKHYGDKRILAQNYESMKKYVLYKLNKLGKWYITAARTGLKRKYNKYIHNYGQSYGEWAEPTDVYITSFKDFASPHPEEGTAYVYFVLNKMIEISKELNKDNDAKLFKEYSDKVKISYEQLVKCPKFSLDTNRQSKLVRPLYMGLLDEEETKYAKERLLKALDFYDWKLGTGFLSTPFILYVLEDMNIEYAYRLLENEKMPGWLFMTKMGANTIWESWEGTSAQKGIASLDHYSKGAVVEWIISRMCGINVVNENEFLFNPIIGGKFTFAESSYLSIYGLVKSSWKINKDKVEYHISIPSNTKAKIVLNNKIYEAGAGEFDFCIDK